MFEDEVDYVRNNGGLHGKCVLMAFIACSHTRREIRDLVAADQGRVYTLRNFEQHCREIAAVIGRGITAYVTVPNGGTVEKQLLFHVGNGHDIKVLIAIDAAVLHALPFRSADTHVRHVVDPNYVQHAVPAVGAPAALPPPPAVGAGPPLVVAPIAPPVAVPAPVPPPAVAVVVAVAPVVAPLPAAVAVAPVAAPPPPPAHEVGMAGTHLFPLGTNIYYEGLVHPPIIHRRPEVWWRGDSSSSSLNKWAELVGHVEAKRRKVESWNPLHWCLHPHIAQFTLENVGKYRDSTLYYLPDSSGLADAGFSGQPCPLDSGTKYANFNEKLSFVYPDVTKPILAGDAMQLLPEVIPGVPSIIRLVLVRTGSPTDLLLSMLPVKIEAHLVSRTCSNVMADPVAQRKSQWALYRQIVGEDKAALSSYNAAFNTDASQGFQSQVEPKEEAAKALRESREVNMVLDLKIEALHDVSDARVCFSCGVKERRLGGRLCKACKSGENKSLAAKQVCKGARIGTCFPGVVNLETEHGPLKKSVKSDADTSVFPVCH